MRLILASSSPRRRELLSQCGLRFEIVKPDIDETRLPHEPLITYVERLSRQKAAAVAENFGAELALIIAADTIVVLAADSIGIDAEGELLGKPADAADARAMLRRLRGRAHQVITAFTLHMHAQPARIITRHVRTRVHMRDFTNAEIDVYVASGDPLDKAGSYAIQNEAFHPVARIEGSYSNVVGLPMEAVSAAFAEIGWPITKTEQPL